MAQIVTSEALIPSLRSSGLYGLEHRYTRLVKSPTRMSLPLRTTPSARKIICLSRSTRYHLTLERRQYCTSSEEKAEEKPESTKEQLETLAMKYGLDPDREDLLKELMARKLLPVLSESQRKYVRHIVKPDGKIVLPPIPMAAAHSKGRKVVAIAGGNGHIARNLKVDLETRGHEVRLISRMPPRAWPAEMDVNRQWYQVLGEEGIFDCDALVQLTGAPYLEKHVVPDTEFKKNHLHTRSSLTTLLAKAMPRTKFKPLVFIQGSHVGIYPSSNDVEYTENYAGPLSQDLIGSVSHDYELKSRLMQDMGLRTVQVRFGHVLGEEGYLQDVHRIDKWGRAWWTGIGTGDQWFPWIHIQDACNLIIHAIENENVQGPVNGVAPEMVKQKQLANLLARALPTHTWKFPMPNTAINWFYPGRAHLLTEGRKVRPQVAQETGFTYIFPTLTETMSSLKPTLVPIKWKNPANRYFDPADPMNPNPLGRL